MSTAVWVSRRSGTGTPSSESALRPNGGNYWPILSFTLLDTRSLPDLGSIPVEPVRFCSLGWE